MWYRVQHHLLPGVQQGVSYKYSIDVIVYREECGTEYSTTCSLEYSKECKNWLVSSFYNFGDLC